MLIFLNGDDARGSRGCEMVSTEYTESLGHVAATGYVSCLWLSDMRVVVWMHDVTVDPRWLSVEKFAILIKRAKDAPMCRFGPPKIGCREMARVLLMARADNSSIRRSRFTGQNHFG